MLVLIPTKSYVTSLSFTNICFLIYEICYSINVSHLQKQCQLFYDLYKYLSHCLYRYTARPIPNTKCAQNLILFMQGIVKTCLETLLSLTQLLTPPPLGRLSQLFPASVLSLVSLVQAFHTTFFYAGLKHWPIYGKREIMR